MSSHLGGSKPPVDKVMELREAVSKFICDGCSVSFSGLAGSYPLAVIHEIARQRKKELTLVCDSPAESGDILIGAGFVRKVEIAWLGYGLAGLASNFRRAVEQGIPRRINVEDYTNYTMGLRFLAGAMGIPFIPTKSLLGSDIVRKNPRIKMMEDPYTGESVALVPAANPDVALIHVSRADRYGNAQLFGQLSNNDILARAARHVIVTCEDLISTEEVRRLPNCTTVPFYCVDAVCVVPYCAHPWNMPYYYVYDLAFRMDYARQVSTLEGWEKWLEEWIYSVDDWNGYCSKVGWERLHTLTMLERMFCPRPGEVQI